GLPGVGHERGDAVADAYASLKQGSLQTGDMRGQLCMAELLAAAVFGDGHQRRMTIATTQQVFGEVQRGAWEPLGVRHRRAFAQHAFGGAMETDLEEIDDGLPE